MANDYILDELEKENERLDSIRSDYSEKELTPEKYVRINRECLGENIVRGRIEDFIHNRNPIE